MRKSKLSWHKQNRLIELFNLKGLLGTINTLLTGTRTAKSLPSPIPEQANMNVCMLWKARCEHATCRTPTNHDIIKFYFDIFVVCTLEL